MFSRRLIHIGLAALTLVSIAPTRRATVQPLAAAQPSQRPAGQSETRLPDGRTLIIGGEGFERNAWIRSSPNDAPRPTDGTLQMARAWHATTVLADGTVLVTGGRYRGGFVEVAELFDPSAGTFTVIAMPAAARRAGHTATLLTDGRILLVGGGDDPRSAAPTELWDLTSQSVVAVSGTEVGRIGHQATLTAEGRVLVSGGRSADGSSVTEVLVIDPINQATWALDQSPAPPANPVIAGTLPHPNATDVPIDVRPVLRFSTAMTLDTLTPDTVALSGPEGVIAIRIIAAEDGRLAFIWPASVLSEGATYRLTVSGARTTGGVPVSPAAVAFTTEKQAQSADGVDEEEWIPDADSWKTGWKANRPPSPWATLEPLMAPSAKTAISGQVLTLDGRPLPEVTLETEDEASTRTDRTGRFLLILADTPGRRILHIDGSTASRPGRRYGFFEYGMEVKAGETNVLNFTIWMPRLHTRHVVKIPSPTTAEVVVTTPYIPGLELHVPPQTTIRGEGGETVTEVGITPIPVDRPPFPLAKNVNVPVYFTVQPGGAYVYTQGPYGTPKGAWLVYPNYQQAEPEQLVQFFHYQPQELGWYVYGIGTVTADRQQVVPDAKTRLYEFTGAMINSGASPPADGPPPGDECSNAGDPVNLATGLFTLETIDMYVPDLIPIVVQRTYRSRDTVVRPFGRGTMHLYSMFLWSAQQYQEADLVLPDGARIHYIRTSPGSGFTNAVFEHKETASVTATPTHFYKSRLSWNGNGWDLKVKDGTVYVFGENAPLQAIRDKHGNTLRLIRTNGQMGNITQVMSPNGRWVSFAYDTSNRVTEAKDNAGRTITYSYDQSDNLVTVTAPANHITTYTYDGNNRLLTIKPPNLQGTPINLVTNEYDVVSGSPTFGWLKKQTNADGGVFEFTYTVANGKSVSTDVKDPRGFIRRVTFNAEGYRLTDTFAVGADQQVTTLTRQPTTHLPTLTVAPNGDRTTATYDAMGNLASVTQRQNTTEERTALYTYEPMFNQLKTVTDALNRTTTYDYDPAGNLEAITDPLDRTTTISYNSFGQTTAITDDLQQTVQFSYSGADLVKTRTPLGFETAQFIDAGGRVIARTDAAGRSTRFEYDANGEVTRVMDPAGATSEFAYFPGGQLQHALDARNNSRAYTYDYMGRLASRTDGLGRTESFEYDLNGNLTRHTDRIGQLTIREYDPFNRLKKITYADQSTIEYTYDAAGRVNQILDSVGGLITRGYDGHGRLTSESTPHGSVSYTYDLVDRRQMMTVAGQPLVDYEYDDVDRLTSVTQGTSLVALTYDDLDRRTGVTLPNGSVTEYAYDADSRLTGLTFKQNGNLLGTLSYGYDQVGNRIELGGAWARTGLPQAVASAVYDAADQLSTWNGVAFSYNQNGNLVSDGVSSYAWDARDQLTAIVGGTTAAFQYDSLGRRVTRNVISGTKSYLYDGSDVVQELQNNVPVRNRLLGAVVDEWFGSQSTASMFPLADAIGSTVALVDGGGSIVAQYTYEPFGVSSMSGASSEGSYLFTGREGDDTGLYYYRARYYAPAMARFVSEDLVTARGSAYPYVGNSPVNYTDPTGWMRVVNNITEQIVDQSRIPGNAVAQTTITGVALGCDCRCVSGSCKLEGTLLIYGRMLLPSRVTRVPAVDRTVVDTNSARNHEYSWHINPAIAAARRLVEPAEARAYSTETECRGKCRELQTSAREAFLRELRRTQAAEARGRRP